MKSVIQKVAMEMCVFPQTGAGSEKSVCYIKICFCQRVIQPNIKLIFWLKGRGIVDFDKKRLRR